MKIFFLIDSFIITNSLNLFPFYTHNNLIFIKIFFFIYYFIINNIFNLFLF